MTPVKSSNIEAIGYAADTRTMTVKFHGGGLHAYADVPQAAYEKFLNADSIGRHFHQHIRNVYKSTKL